jgi:hypothetical protein
MNVQKPSAHSLGWMKSLLWLAFAVACFHLAYASIHFPAAGLLIFGYAWFLVRLANQPTVRRAFYFGLATGYLCYAPQLFFFWRIFNGAAIVLWFVVAFWIGLFTGIVYGCIRRWGKERAMWLVPVIWTGLEYFRSELYYLRFSWLNIGYALPARFSGSGALHLGMYSVGFLIFGVAAVSSDGRRLLGFLKPMTLARLILIIFALGVASTLFLLSIPVWFTRGMPHGFPSPASRWSFLRRGLCLWPSTGLSLKIPTRRFLC